MLFLLDLFVGSESHTSFPSLAKSITRFILESLDSLPTDKNALVEHRYNKFRTMGEYDLLNETERNSRVEAARKIPAPIRPARTKPNANTSRLLNYLTTRKQHNKDVTVHSYRFVGPAINSFFSFFFPPHTPQVH